MDIASLRRRFDQVTPLTVGVEEELMLLDAGTLDLAPRAPELLRALGGDPPFKLELPAAQVELFTPPCATVGEAVVHLRDARRDLARAANRIGLRVAGAGAHPFTAPLGVLNADGGRYDATRARFGLAAEAQLVCGLHVHVAVGGAHATIAVHDALRSFLPELAALAAAAPYLAGRDTGFASVRPLIAGLLPRQGVPPALRDMQGFADQLEWGRVSGAVAEPRGWWWELRPHAGFGTLEVRVCDTQPSVDGAGAIVGVVHALVAELRARHEAGELTPAAEGWRIAENRWSACCGGLAGAMADLDGGCPEPTAQRVARLLNALAPAARRVGCTVELRRAEELAAAGGEAASQRAVGEERGPRGLTAWLAERFLGAPSAAALS